STVKVPGRPRLPGVARAGLLIAASAGLLVSTARSTAGRAAITSMRTRSTALTARIERAATRLWSPPVIGAAGALRAAGPVIVPLPADTDPAPARKAPLRPRSVAEMGHAALGGIGKDVLGRE